MFGSVSTEHRPEKIALVTLLKAHHDAQLSLCDELEELADGLPENLMPQKCLSIAWQIYPIVKAAHDFEEKSLFPLLTEQDKSDERLSKRLERLKFEHWEDESFAMEIATTLREVVGESGENNIEKLSYMLRGFFEGIRRHVAFEEEYIFPLLTKLDGSIEELH